MYSYATNTTKATNEANYVVSLLQKYGVRPSELAYSAYYDLESNNSTKNLSIDQNATNVETFVSILSSKGYPVNVYSYKSYFENNLNSPIDQEYINMHHGLLNMGINWHSKIIIIKVITVGNIVQMAVCQVLQERLMQAIF